MIRKKKCEIISFKHTNFPTKVKNKLPNKFSLNLKLTQYPLIHKNVTLN